MNLIQLFQNENNCSKTFQRASDGRSMHWYGNLTMRQHMQIKDMREEDFLADDWEVVREKKTITLRNVEWRQNASGPVFPEAKMPGSVQWQDLLKKPPMTITLEWEE